MPTLNHESECSTSSVTSFNTSAVDYYEAKVTELNSVQTEKSQFDLFHDGVTQTFLLRGLDKKMMESRWLLIWKKWWNVYIVKKLFEKDRKN